jgi:isopenicillin-N epimerase
VPDTLGVPAANVPAGLPSGSTYPPDPLRELLYERFGIEVPVFAWPHTPDPERPRLRLLRVSAQLYNSAADYERLAGALRSLSG